MEKMILVLANSIKKGGRCVAGIEITNQDISNPEFGTWIRPIDSTQHEGMLKISTTIEVKPLEVILIEVTSPANDPDHPEDWIIAPKVAWERAGTFANEVLPHLLSLAHVQKIDPDLWSGKNFVSKGSAKSTLQLLVLKKSTIVNCGFESFGGDRPKLKTRMTCGDSPHHHELSVTDPAFTAKHGMSPAQIGANELKKVTVSKGAFIVISLTPAFQGGDKQYKVIASIIE